MKLQSLRGIAKFHSRTLLSQLLDLLMSFLDWGKKVDIFSNPLLLATFPYPVTIINQEIEEVEKGDFEFLHLYWST